MTRLLLLLFPSSIAAAQVLPPGTVVPVMLDSPLNATKGQSDKKIEGRVMQDVLVVGMDRIRERSRITGHIVSATKPGKSGSTLVVKFDVIQDRGRRISITAALLAFASDNAVSDAQSPINLTSDRDPMTQWTTRQVGGDVVASSVPSGCVLSRVGSITGPAAPAVSGGIAGPVSGGVDPRKESMTAPLITGPPIFIR